MTYIKLKKLYLSDPVKYENDYVNYYINKLEGISLNEAGQIVDNDNTLSDDSKIKLLEYLVDRKIKETCYSKCKHISAIEYLNSLEQEEGDY